jgi:thiol-disulfide isomerase/thioredoxin
MEKLGFFVFPAPVDVGDFTVETLGGGSSTLSSAKGKIVLLNFWATWCPPCRAEMPSIEALWKKTKGKAFTVFAISVGEEKATVKAFIDEQKISYPIFLDPTGRLGAAFNASSIPTTYIMDKTGKAIAGVQGSREYDGPEVMALFSDLAAK